MTEQLIKNEFGFYSVKNLPTKEFLEDYYAKKYFQQKDTNHPYCNAYSKDELIYFVNKAKIAEYITSKSSQVLLDVGYGEGFFAKYFFDKKWDVTTLDFSDYGLSTHNQELLTNHISGDVFQSLEKITREEKKYDLINLSNVLEHVIDPISLLKSLKNLMHKDTYLRISVPNDFSNFQNFLLEKEYTKNTWVCVPDHLHYFTFESLENLLKSLNFIVDVSMGEFPIELFISNEKSNYTKDRSLGGYAHKSRIEVDNFLFDEGIEKYINFYQASAEIGFSRQVVVYVKIK